MAQVHGASVGASRDQAELGTSGAPPPVFRVENSSTADAASTATSAQASAELRDNVFAFDLNGFVVVRGALSAAEVARCNEAIDAHASEMHERTDPALRNTKAGTPLAGDGKSGRLDMSGMLGWPDPQCTPFRELLAHPKLVPMLHKLVGQGYRLDHLPLLIAQNKGSEGFHLHGGPLTSEGGFNPHLQYVCKQGTVYNSLLAMSVVLTPHNEGSGGFCVVRGSHKSNFAIPEAMMHGEQFREHIYQPVTQPGDVVFFSESTVHGALPWTEDFQRRIALYRFAPPNCAYGRSYHPSWPAQMTEGCTPDQLAVLEPPYNNRLDRPYVSEDGAVETQSRSDVKKQFDAEVFGTRYF